MPPRSPPRSPRGRRGCGSSPPSATSARSAARRAWLEPVNPLIARQEVRFKIPASPDGEEVTLSLVARDAGDGNEHDFVVWQQPRLVAPGRPDLLLARRPRGHPRPGGAARADVRRHGEVSGRRRRSRRGARQGRRRGAGPETRRRSRRLAGLARLPRHRHGRRRGSSTGTSRTSSTSAAGYDFIKGWGSSETPLLLANSSDQHVRIPGNMKPHSVAVHPSPTLQRRGRLAQPGDGDVARRSDGDARAPRVRQRRDLVARTAARARRGSGSPPASRRGARR